MKKFFKKNLPKIYVLTLIESNRGADLCSILSDHEVEFEVINGIDGRNGLPNEFEKQIDRKNTELRFGRSMSDGEYACALSHLKIYQRILDSGIERGIIFEDDAIPDKQLFNLDVKFFKEADLILLYHLNTYVSRNIFAERKGAGTLPLRNSPFMACAYVISAEACKYIIDHAYPVTRCADWPIDLTKINAVAAWPFLASHNDSYPSNLNAGRRKYRKSKKNFNYFRKKISKLISKKIA